MYITFPAFPTLYLCPNLFQSYQFERLYLKKTPSLSPLNTFVMPQLSQNAPTWIPITSFEPLQIALYLKFEELRSLRVAQLMTSYI
jgi:hypothetical protein